MKADHAADRHPFDFVSPSFFPYSQPLWSMGSIHTTYVVGISEGPGMRLLVAMDQSPNPVYT